MEPGPSCEWFLLEFTDSFSIQYCGATDSRTLLDPQISGKPLREILTIIDEKLVEMIQMLAEHYNLSKFSGTIRLPIPNTHFLLKPTQLRITDLSTCPPSIYFLPRDTPPIQFYLVDHPKMLVFQLEDGDKRRIYLEPSTPHPAEPHVRHIRGVRPPLQSGPGYFQEYNWKLAYRDELRVESPVKLYFMSLESEVVFHTVSVPLEILKLVGYYSNGTLDCLFLHS
jgi:hypothetical protein